MGKLHIMFFFITICTCEYMQLIYGKINQKGLLDLGLLAILNFKREKISVK